MFNLFNKGPKVRAGKPTQEEKKKPVVGMVGGKSARPANVLGDAWKKLQKMDRKQAYTFGGIAVVALVALISIASMGGQDPEDFNHFETRGYDLANMPFSTDEAEQYLLASKYPDMNDKSHAGLYSKSEKEARQAEDAAEAQAKLNTSATSKGSEYRPNRYYGGGGGGASASPTQVGELNSAGLKSASGSGMKSTFGPQGDFSNFRSQEKGKDKFVPNGPGKGNARTALYQTAKASRAAAGLKNDKLLNAKKAMMGGNVKGSDAFLDDSGAVNLDKLAGLELDTNAPISSADLGGFDEALQDANDDGAQEDKDEDELEWWQELLQELVAETAKMVVNELVAWGSDSMRNAVDAARAGRLAEQQTTFEFMQGADNFTMNTYEQTYGLKEFEGMSDEQLSIFDVQRTTVDGTNSYTHNGNPLGENDTLSLTRRETDQLNVQRFQEQFNGPNSSQAQKDYYKAYQAQAQINRSRAEEGVWSGNGGSNYNSSNRSHRNSNSGGSQSITVNGVTHYGKMQSDGTFLSNDNQKFTSEGSGRDTTWTLSN
ncbi:MAG: hypothetical protein IKW63_04525 [Elusimicrobiaceae bacterium]|nr:hypothetical protein [Elusimicrobiaceae bacterium]